MKTTDWKEYYDRWSSWFNRLENKEEIIGKVIKKYGNKRYITDRMWFDNLFEYAVRYGNHLDKPIGFEVLEESYNVNGYIFSLVYVEKAFITITHENK